jgi:hypothetical protein
VVDVQNMFKVRELFCLCKNRLSVASGQNLRCFEDDKCRSGRDGAELDGRGALDRERLRSVERGQERRGEGGWLRGSGREKAGWLAWERGESRMLSDNGRGCGWHGGYLNFLTLQGKGQDGTQERMKRQTRDLYL